MGTVVAVGPGDKHPPFDWSKCWKCKQDRTSDYQLNNVSCRCGSFSLAELSTAETDWNSVGDRHEMLTKPGDRVVYSRRPSAPGGDCDIVIEGVMYLMFHEEQSAYAVIEA